MQRICQLGHVYSGKRCPQCNRTAARGYDHRWRRLSEDFRVRNPLCQDCEKEGRVTAVDEVHHIVPISSDDSKRLELDNLVGLCRECHRKRHESEGH